ncbi:MAG: hypothetical protein MJ160_03005 [Treponema sp.]|nr:hypothetical protein [Treponema sp.]
MSSLFETAMLICFGLSWPLNAIKAFKARTAKGSSLAFILLIITGYLAGITAKILNHQMNYVLVVYFLNLAIVMTNLFAYFRNKALDKEKEKMVGIAEQNDSVILFGGTKDKEIPVAEIAQDYELNFKMMNRSVFGLSLKDAKKNFHENIEKLNPEAVLIHLGEADLDLFNRNNAEFDVQYLELIDAVKAQNKNRRIALISNVSADGSEIYADMNRHIKAIADSEKCTFVNIDNAKLWNPESTKELMAFMYDIGFDQPLKVKKPLGDIAEILYSYAYQNGILHYVESQAV